MLECGVGIAHLQWVKGVENQGRVPVIGEESCVSTFEGRRFGITRGLG